MGASALCLRERLSGFPIPIKIARLVKETAPDASHPHMLDQGRIMIPARTPQTSGQTGETNVLHAPNPPPVADAIFHRLL